MLHNPILKDQNATQEMLNKSYRETVAHVGGSYTNAQGQLRNSLHLCKTT